MIEIRPSRPGEEERQRELWRTAFGDEEEVIDCFYQCCYRSEDMLVLAEDGRICTMLALLPMELVAPAGQSASAWYVYALATDPDQRKKGFGRQLLHYADFYLRERLADCLTVVPAEPSLHRYFSTVGFQPCFATRKLELLPAMISPANRADALEQTGAAVYNRIREAQLEGGSRVRYSDDLIEYQKGLAELSGAGLYQISVEGETGCAAVEYVDRDSVLCKELLISPAHMERAVALIAARHPARRYHVRTPACWEGLPGGYLQPFGMVKWYNRDKEALWAACTHSYMGLGFD
mgnify:FL=1